MLQRISSPYRAGAIGGRAICVPCLIVIAFLATAMPLFAETTPDEAPARVVPVQLVSTTDDTAAVAVPDGDAGSTTLAALEIEDKAGDVDEPGGIVIGQGRPEAVRTPDRSKLPGKLAVAGLLLIPLDKGLTGIIPRTEAGRSTDGLTETINKLGTVPVLLTTIGGLYAVGDSYDKDTAKLALAALLNAGVMTEGLKRLTGRERPGISGDVTRFHGPGSNAEDFKSFPSGHTSAAFAVATVMAKRHPKQKWLYYGLASAVGFARIRKSAHFPSDVLVGAAIGMHAGNNAIRGGANFLSIKF